MATVTVVRLSDGEPCEVKRLGIFDLDDVGPSLLGPFIYTFEMANGQVVEEEYDPRRLTKPPQHPGIPETEIEKHSPSWYALLEWQTYKSAIAHERKRIISVIDYVMAVSRAILEIAVDEKDHSRIQTEGDWIKVREAALVPELTAELLAETFKKHFKAHFQGKDVLDALNNVAPGSGGYDAIRVWEINTMSAIGFTEEEWASLPLAERARKVAASNLPKLLEVLETDKRMKELAAERAANN